jgi:hypothetical protein
LSNFHSPFIPLPARPDLILLRFARRGESAMIDIVTHTDDYRAFLEMNNDSRTTFASDTGRTTRQGPNTLRAAEQNQRSLTGILQGSAMNIAAVLMRHE